MADHSDHDFDLESDSCTWGMSQYSNDLEWTWEPPGPSVGDFRRRDSSSPTKPLQQHIEKPLAISERGLPMVQNDLIISNSHFQSLPIGQGRQQFEHHLDGPSGVQHPSKSPSPELNNNPKKDKMAERPWALVAASAPCDSPPKKPLASGDPSLSVSPEKVGLLKGSAAAGGPAKEGSQGNVVLLKTTAAAGGPAKEGSQGNVVLLKNRPTTPSGRDRGELASKLPMRLPSPHAPPFIPASLAANSAMGPSVPILMNRALSGSTIVSAQVINLNAAIPGNETRPVSAAIPIPIHGRNGASPYPPFVTANVDSGALGFPPREATVNHTGRHLVGLEGGATDLDPTDLDPDYSGAGNDLVGSPSSWPPRYCFNCGDRNHYYKKCPNPVTSYGMILYRVDQDPTSGANVIRYLLIQRDYSPEFRSLINNFRYLENQPDQIEHLSQFLTGLEIRSLGTYDYPTLYSKINRYYLQRRHSKHQQILHSILRQTELLHSARQVGKRLAALSLANRPLEPDWGFPKGRRNKHNYESDIDCARREVGEETGLGHTDYTIISGLQPREIYKGTNNIYYQHNYYVGRVTGACPIFYNPLNATQTCEIRKIGWFTYEEALWMFRNYHTEKREMLSTVHKTLLQRGT